MISYDINLIYLFTIILLLSIILILLYKFMDLQLIFENIIERSRNLLTFRENMELSRNINKLFRHWYIYLIFTVIIHILCVYKSVSTNWAYSLYLFGVIRFFIADTIVLIMESITPSMNRIREEVATGITNIGSELLDRGNLFTKVANSFNKHKVGISTCVVSMAKSKSVMSVSEEIIKIGSMLELESSISDGVVGKIAQLTGGALRPAINTHSDIDISKLVNMAGLGFSLAGKQVTGIDLSHFLRTTHMNTQAIKSIYEIVFEAGKELGLISDPQATLIKELSESVCKVRTNYEWVGTCLAMTGNEFIKPEGKKRIEEYKQDIEEILRKLREIDRTKLKLQEVVTEARTIVNESVKQLQQVKLVTERKPRVVPVGICLYGISQVGKTTLAQEIKRRVNTLASNKYPDLFPGSKFWSMWSCQQRDDFDQNYHGDEWMYEDDAFCDKSNKDHLKWLSFMSGSATSTVQAHVNLKGLPFNIKAAIVSTNTLPNASSSINNIEAVWQRFKFAVHCDKISDIDTSNGLYDSSFRHLELKCNTMHSVIMSPNHEQKGPIITLDELVNKIVDALAFNETTFRSQLENEDREFVLDDIVTTHNNEDNTELLYRRFRENNRLQVVTPTIDHTSIHNNFTLTTLSSLRNAVRAGKIENSLVFYPWAKYLVHVATGEECTEEFLGTVEPYEFIKSLSVWAWKDGVTPQEFQYFPAVVIEDESTTTQYLWMPALNNGSQAIALNEFIIEALKDNMLFYKIRMFFNKYVVEGYYNDAEALMNMFLEMRRTFLSNPNLIRYTITVLGAGMPCHLVYCGIIYSEMVLRQITQIRRNMVGENQSLMANCLYAYNYTHVIKTALWDKFTKITEVFKDHTKSLLIRILDFFGIDIGPWITSFIDLAGDLVQQTTMFGLLSLFGYALWRIYELLFRKKNSDSTTSHSQMRETKHRRQVKRSQKVIQLHQELNECTDDCRTELPADEIEWVLNGKKENFAQLEWLETLNDMNGSGLFRYSSHSGCNDYYSYEYKDMPDPLIQNKWTLKSHGKGQIPHILDSKNYFKLTYKYSYSYDEDILDEVDFSIISKLNIEEYYIDATMYYDDGDKSGSIDIYLVNKIDSDSIEDITPREFRSLFREKDKAAIIRRRCESTIKPHSSTQSVDFAKQIKDLHMVSLSVLPLDKIDPVVKHQLYGITHKNMIITNNHAFSKVGTYVAFWKPGEKQVNKYRIAQVVASVAITDEAYLRILPYSQAKKFGNSVIPIDEVYRSILPHLLTEADYKKQVQGSKGFIWTHDLQVLLNIQTTMGQPTSYSFWNNQPNVVRDYLEINKIEFDTKYKKDGQCGSPIFSYTARHNPSLIGFYAASSFNGDFGTMLWKEKLTMQEKFANNWDDLEVHTAKDIPCILQNDGFMDFIVKGQPVDMASGPEVSFIGKYEFSTTPVSNPSLSHWALSPWADEFEEQLQPAPLSPHDDRIEVSLPVNRLGEPSLLKVLNEPVSQTIPQYDIDLLEFCSRQLEDEMVAKIGNITSTPSDIEELLEQALNGDADNEHVTGIQLNKASGIPWCEIKPLKSDFIDIDETGHRTFNNEDGKYLKDRVVDKLLYGRKGIRLLSFSNAKLKDAAIKLDYVKIGRGRLFHMIPIDKVIYDLALFGNFKEAYAKAKLNLNSAIGMNPHSLDVNSLVEHLNVFPNYSDKDFTNFDQRLGRELLLQVNNIQANVIQRKNPDDIWYYARKVSGLESVDTLVVEYKDISLTNRGNCSGEVKTTIDNNIARELACYYGWCKIVIASHGYSNLEESGFNFLNELSLAYFRENRRSIGFGDDEIESISDRIVDKYNFVSMKEQLEGMGMVVTPGSKCSVISNTVPFSELSFLKRKFVFQHDIWTMPLNKRSLESPFVWTRVKSTQFDIWYELVKGRIFEEAVLHGQDYYNEFVEKLRKCKDEALLRFIEPLLTVDYLTAIDKYKKQRYEY